MQQHILIEVLHTGSLDPFLTLRDIGDHGKALKDLEMAIKLDPHCASAYNNRGVVYGDLGRLEDAVREYSKALEIDPCHVIATRNR